MNKHQRVVWIDHHEARIFGVDDALFEEAKVLAPSRHLARHPGPATREHEHPEEMHRFLREVATNLDSAGQVLIVGPSTAKLELLRHLGKEARATEAKVVGIETVDHPTDGQLVAYARRYFRSGPPS